MPAALLPRLKQAAIGLFQSPPPRDPQTVAECLRSLRAVNPAAAQAVQAMPFLHPEPGPGTLEAVMSLLQLAIVHPQLADQAVQQPMTAQDTPRLAALFTAAQTGQRHGRDLIRQILDPRRTAIEEARDAHGLRFAILRPPGARRHPETVNRLPQAAEVCRRLFPRPMPASSVVVLMADPGIESTAAGNTASAFIMRPDHEVPSTPSHRRLLRNLTHETARFHWHRNEPWINEGLADLADILAEEPDLPARPNRYPSPHSPAELLRRRVPKEAEDHYSAGQRFFIALLNDMGLEQFREVLGRLYDRSQRDPLTYAGLRREFPRELRPRLDRLYHLGAGPEDGPGPEPPARPHPAVLHAGAARPLQTDGAEAAADAGGGILTLHCRNRPFRLITLSEYGPDGLRYDRRSIGLPPPPPGGQTELLSLPCGPPPGRPWLPGAHVVNIDDARTGEPILRHRYTMQPSPRS